MRPGRSRVGTLFAGEPQWPEDAGATTEGVWGTSRRRPKSWPSRRSVRSISQRSCDRDPPDQRVQLPHRHLRQVARQQVALHRPLSLRRSWFDRAGVRGSLHATGIRRPGSLRFVLPTAYRAMVLPLSIGLAGGGLATDRTPRPLPSADFTDGGLTRSQDTDASAFLAPGMSSAGPSNAEAAMSKAKRFRPNRPQSAENLRNPNDLVASVPKQFDPLFASRSVSPRRPSAAHAAHLAHCGPLPRRP
jgi:hypothetical protein